MIEVDIASPSLYRLQVMAALGVAEVWRWLDGTLTILGRTERGDGFTECPVSGGRTALTAVALNELPAKSRRMKRRAWLREIREWARQNQPQGGGRP